MNVLRKPALVPDETPLDAKATLVSAQDPDKIKVHAQFAALCYRMVKGKPEVLLVTSRRAGRWILPKGWPMKGRKPAKVALQEAWEEAGVKGNVSNHCLGVFSYQKTLQNGRVLPCGALVYPVKVKSLANSWPEHGQRRRKWFTLKKAAARLDNSELAWIVENFDPRRLRG